MAGRTMLSAGGCLTMSDELEFLERDSLPPAYEIRDLGLLFDGRFCQAKGVNSHGAVVGEADMTLGVHAVSWRRGVLTDLAPDSLYPCRAIDINDDGRIVGVATLDPDLGPVSVLWVEGKMIDLSNLGLPGDGVRAINNQGQIVGESYFSDRRAPGAFLWQCGNLTDLSGPNVDGGGTAEAINQYGQAAGHISALTYFDQAFFWSGEESRDLGIGRALAINDYAEIAGRTYQGNNEPIACFWTDFRRREIPLLPGWNNSEALAINNGGEIVGWMAHARGDQCAFLWKNEYVIDLNDVIDLNQGWNLQAATAINESGQIVGWGFLEHRHHGFILTPHDRSSRPSRREPPPRGAVEHAPIPDPPAGRVARLPETESVMI